MESERHAVQGWRHLGRLLVLGAAYLGTGSAGLLLPYHGSAIALLWLPTGIAVGALYRWGGRYWPGVLLGAVLVNLEIGVPWGTALAIGVGNTLGPLLSVALLRMSGFHPLFDRQRDVLVFCAAGAAGMLLPATGGVAALIHAGIEPSESWAQAWGTWFLGDAMGVLFAGPLVLATGHGGDRHTLAHHSELTVWWVVAATVAVALHGDVASGGVVPALLFLPLAVVVWSALRFSIGVTSLFVLGISVLAAWGVATGRGPFQNADVHAGVRMLWACLATLIVLGLMIAALRAERASANLRMRESEDRYQRLFHLTPLPMAVIDRETERFLAVNDAAVAAYGYTRDEYRSLRAFELAVDPVQPRLAQLLAGVIPATSPVLRYRVKHDRIVSVEVSGHPLDYDGRPAMLVVSQDVTERQQLERAVLDAGNREREHLSEELHDGLGQDITGIALLASGLASSARRAGLDIAQDIERVAEIARHAVSTCRRIARGLSPLSESNGGLVQTLSDMVERFQEGHGPLVEFRSRGAESLRLSRESADHLYRIAQEALTNALKHANARRIDITLDVDPSCIRLVVSDDGSGYAATGLASPALGLKIMRHRAAAIGASLSAAPGAGGGWRVICECPQTSPLALTPPAVEHTAPGRGVAAVARANS